MNDIKIIKGPPSEIKIIQWGYDENLYFAESDEELILTDIDYLPVLIKLGAEPDCPKNGIIMSILYKLAREIFISRNLEEAERLLYHATKKPFKNPSMSQWVLTINNLNDALLEPKPMDLDKAENLANLLLGIDNVKKTGKILRGYWEFQNTASVEDPQNFLYINGETGDWIYSKFKVLTTDAE